MSDDTPQPNGKTKPKAKRKFLIKTFEDLDGRTRAVRAARDLHHGFLSDLGGADYVTTAQRELSQRAACLGAALEDLEAAMLGGDEISLSDYTTMVNAQRRVLSDIGLERRAHDITARAPSVEAYLAHRKEAAE
jgi:hypothetical protein